MERRIRIVESALAQFSKNCGADSAVKEKIKAELSKLKKDSDLGYPVPFAQPLFYQLPVNDYRIHYRIDPTDVVVLYMGIPGVC